MLTINIIYPSGLFRKFWRLIPTDSGFMIEGKLYLYNDEAIIKNNDWYAYKSKAGELVARIEDKEYNLNLLLGIKQRWERWPELYYQDGNPWPINMTRSSNKELMYNSGDFKRLRESDTLAKLHAMLARTDLGPIVIVLAGAALLVAIFIALKVYGVMK